jgi:predicted metal-dependent HD superfamily phosphohydrolase
LDDAGKILNVVALFLEYFAALLKCLDVIYQAFNARVRDEYKSVDAPQNHGIGAVIEAGNWQRKKMHFDMEVAQLTYTQGQKVEVPG